MYGWIWRRLPGNTPLRTLVALLLVVAVAALLFFVVFPKVEAKLPFNDVTVNGAPATGLLR